jgi:hypothetical protein
MGMVFLETSGGDGRPLVTYGALVDGAILSKR